MRNRRKAEQHRAPLAGQRPPATVQRDLPVTNFICFSSSITSSTGALSRPQREPRACQADGPGRAECSEANIARRKATGFGHVGPCGLSREWHCGHDSDVGHLGPEARAPPAAQGAATHTRTRSRVLGATLAPATHAPSAPYTYIYGCGRAVVDPTSSLRLAGCHSARQSKP